MRRQGLRLVQFWVPDTSAPGFVDECRRQSSLASAERRHERRILAEIGELPADLDLGDSPEFAAPKRRGRR
jgi:hypothetical protein